MKTISISEETYEKLKDQILSEEKAIKEKSEKKLEIKNRWTGEVIYTSQKTTYKDAVEEAVSKGADLGGADLRGADLRGAYLGGANLGGADLGGADLRDADFYHTKFYGKGGTTKIKKNQVNDFFKALGVIVEE